MSNKARVKKVISEVEDYLKARRKPTNIATIQRMIVRVPNLATFKPSLENEDTNGLEKS